MNKKYEIGKEHLEEILQTRNLLCTEKASLEKSDAEKQASREIERRGNPSLKKMNQEAKELENFPLFLCLKPQ